MGLSGVQRSTTQLGGYLGTGGTNRFDFFFSVSPQASSTATYVLVSIAPAVVARRPLLCPHCAALLTVHAVSPSGPRRASRFLGVSWYSTTPFEWYAFCPDWCSRCGEIRIFVSGSTLGRFCRYLGTGCADLVGGISYVLPTYSSTIIHGFMSIAPTVTVRAPSPLPIPLLCYDVAYGISPSVLGRTSRFRRTWYYSMKAFR
ncbi:hypothetical protein EDD15DRAFT_2301827 [Pisolithus albus]|nr:hypothetical protein EDD15DRAFT_2326816 [Pisolithus albus]KAI5985457.1 hypothetical protein EDD15DRAFT_2301827 [Pisolithus albus]